MLALAGILYNSWPLGYWLNYSTARYGLASDLDEPGHPYSWVFILFDILVSLCLVAAAFVAWRMLKSSHWSKLWAMVITGLVVFGVFTAISAAAPTNCQTSAIQICAKFDRRLFSPDGIGSAIAAIGLFVSLIGINWLLYRGKAHSTIQKLAQATLVVWLVSIIIFLIAAATNSNAHLTQQVQLLASGLALVVIGLGISALIEQRFGSISSYITDGM